MSHRKWRQIKQQLSWWPDMALLGCCLVSLHFLCNIPVSHAVYSWSRILLKFIRFGCYFCPFFPGLNNAAANGTYSITQRDANHPFDARAPREVKATDPVTALSRCHFRQQEGSRKLEIFTSHKPDFLGQIYVWETSKFSTIFTPEFWLPLQSDPRQRLIDHTTLWTNKKGREWWQHHNHFLLPVSQTLSSRSFL